jgi:hypothetical protein
MAATIQHIELPKKPRALDSSTSVQEVSQELVTNGSMEADANWNDQNTPTTNERSTAQANGGTYSRKVVGNSSGDGIKSDTFSLVEGRTYRVEFYYYLTSGSNTLLARLQDGDGSDLGVSEVFGTKDAWTKITFTRVAENTGDASYFKIYQNQIGDSTFYVDDVSVKEIDTFSNNNHGKIYSGRALEFDGVSDHLTTGYGSGLNPTTKPITIAAWANHAAAASSDVLVGVENGTNRRLYIAVSNDTARMWDIGIQDSAFKNNQSDSKRVESDINTWYRVVVVLSGTTATLYVNGVESISKTYSSYTLSSDFLIGNNGDSAFSWNGLISDVQFWDAAWSAGDIAYDFANPESLALNASGSALTEGNLKLWYPMQDGHRGQQSYILDGANTGLGVEVLLNADFSDNEPAAGNAYLSGGLQFGNWIENQNSGLRKFTLIPDGVRCDILEQSDEVWHTRIYSDVLSLTEGQSYRFTAEVRSSVDGNFNAAIEATNGGDAQPDPDVFTAVTNSEFSLVNTTFNYIPDSDGENGVSSIVAHLYPSTAIPAGGFYEVRNVSLKPINDKHHATTVFYGDTLWDTAASTNGSVSNWTAFGSNTLATDSGAVRGTFEDNISGVYIYLRDAKDLSSDLTVGRTYQLQYDVKVNSGSVTPKLAVSGGTTYSGSAVTSTTFVTNTIDFVCESADGHYFYTDQMHTGEIVYLDNFSLKEVGVASGWTDADQQLDIAQPALQSYNELAWSDGNANVKVEVASLAADLGSNDFSISHIITPNNITGNNTYLAFNVGSGDGRVVHRIDDGVVEIYIEDSNAANVGYAAGSGAGAIKAGQTYHIVEVFDRSADLVTVYINGVASGTTIDISSLNGDIDCNGALGFYNFSSDPAIEGFITEAALWKNTKLNAAEVLELYNDGKPLDALTHTKASTLYGYWRNSGLSTWVNLANPGTKDSTTNTLTETLLIPQGVDGSRDAQGFIMNKARNTSSLNLPATAGLPISSASVDVSKTPELTIGTGAYTLEAWAKAGYIQQPASSGSSFNTIISVGTSTVSADATAIGYQGSEDKFKFHCGGDGTVKAILSSAVTRGNWYHVVAGRKADGTGFMYVDGTAINPSTYTSLDIDEVDLAATKHTIGHDGSASGRFYTEPIDGVKIYNKALSETEIQRNYKATKGSHRN